MQQLIHKKYTNSLIHYFTFVFILLVCPLKLVYLYFCNTILLSCNMKNKQDGIKIFLWRTKSTKIKKNKCVNEYINNKYKCNNNKKLKNIHGY